MGGGCRGKLIQRHENHPMGTEATLIYNLGPLSWLINLIRRFMGIWFGFVGQTIYHILDFVLNQVLSFDDAYSNCIIAVKSCSARSTCAVFSPEGSIP